MALIRLHLKQLFSQPLMMALLGLYCFVLAVFANQFAHQFVQLQAANTENISLSGDFFAPLNGLSLLLCWLILPLTAAQLAPRRAARGIQRLLNSFPIAPNRIWLADWVSLALFIGICHVLLVIIHLPILLASTIDWPVYALQLLAHGLACLLFGTLILLLNQYAKSPLNAIIGGFGLLFVLWLIPLASRQWPLLASGLSPFDLMAHFRHLTLGLLHLPSLLALLLGVTALVAAKLVDWRHRPALQEYSFKLLALLLWLVGTNINGQWDLTSNQRYSLDPLLAEQLAQLPDQLTITSYGLDDSASEEVKLRLLNPLQQTLSRLDYQAIAANAQWEDREPQGLLLQWPEQEIWIGYPFSLHPQHLLYQSLSRLNQRQHHWIIFSDGHQESQLSRQAIRSLSKLAEELQQRGFRVTQSRLQQLGVIPDNTQLLVIASSRQAWLAGEQQTLLDYLQTGGNLLWLRDPEDDAMTWLENYLGVVKVPGTLIDPAGYQQGTPHPAVVLLDDYEPHPLLQSMNSRVALPWASALSKVNSRWQLTPLLHTHEQVWTELQPDQEQLSFDPDLGELQGRFPTLMVLQRQQGSKIQSVVVTGDSHFLSDQAINNYDNKQLALNLFHWLVDTDPEHLPRLTQARDKFLSQNPAWQWLLNGLNPFVLPLIFLIGGAWQWQRQRKT